jgi:amino acid permease
LLLQGVVIERPCEPWVADVFTAACAVVIILLSLPMEIGRLAHAAELSVAAICFLVVTLIYFGASEVVGAGTDTRNGTTNSSVVWWPTDDRDELNALGSAFPVILFAFGCQFQLIDIYRGVEAARVQSKHTTASLAVRTGSSHFVPVIVAACSSMLVLFALTGVFGVLAFPGQVIEGDILTMLASKGALGDVSRGLLIVACILAAPLLVHCARSCISSIVVYFFGTHRPVLRNRAMTVAVTLLALTIALSGVDFLVGVSAMGAFLCPPLFYLLPGGALLRLVWRSHCAVVGLNESGDSALLANVSEGGSGRTEDRKLSKESAFSAALLGGSLIVTGVGTAVVSVWVFVQPFQTPTPASSPTRLPNL